MWMLAKAFRSERRRPRRHFGEWRWKEYSCFSWGSPCVVCTKKPSGTARKVDVVRKGCSARQPADRSVIITAAAAAATAMEIMRNVPRDAGRFRKPKHCFCWLCMMGGSYARRGLRVKRKQNTSWILESMMCFILFIDIVQGSSAWRR